MRRKILQFISAFMCMMLFLVNVSSKIVFAEDTKVSVRVDVQYGQTEARGMLSLINEFRTGSDAWEWNEDNETKKTHENLSELQYDYALEKVAMQRAAEIALSYSHTRPDGSGCFTAYGSYSYQSCGENIAAGYSSATDVFVGWQETDDDYAGQGHRRNMLSEDFNAIGIGHVYYNGIHYWVQEFAKTSSVDSSTTSAVDSVETAAIEVSKSYISNVSISCDKSEISMKAGETANLPEVSLTVNIQEHWPESAKCPNITIGDGVQWSSSDENIVTVTGNEIQAVAGGNAKLKAQVLDAFTEINITVEADETEQPSEPSEPETPSEPEKPTTPETPSEPEEPTTPSEPEEPTTPDIPSEPEKPTTPETPSEPEKPTTPETPSEPEEPTTPETPSEPEKPSEPDQSVEETTSNTNSSSNTSSSNSTSATAAAPKVVQPSYTTKDNRKVNGWQEVMDAAYSEAQADNSSVGSVLLGNTNIDINITAVTDLTIPKGTVISMKQKAADYNFYYQNIAITVSHESLAEWTEELNLKMNLDKKENFGAGFDAFHIGKDTNKAIPEKSIINVMLTADKAGSYAYIFGKNNQTDYELLSTVPISEFGTIAISTGTYNDYMILY